MNGVENPTSNSVIGNGSGDVETNGVPFWLIVDLGTAKILTGLQTKHWGASFAPKKIEIFVSENNRDWVELKGGTTATSGGT